MLEHEPKIELVSAVGSLDIECCYKMLPRDMLTAQSFVNCNGDEYVNHARPADKTLSSRLAK